MYVPRNRALADTNTELSAIKLHTYVCTYIYIHTYICSIFGVPVDCIPRIKTCESVNKINLYTKVSN